MAKKEFTFSEFQNFGICPWAWQKRYVELKRPKKKSVKLSFGAAIHKGIETFYKREGDPVGIVQDYVTKVRTEAEAEGLPLDSESYLILRKAEGFIRTYIDHYAGDFDKYGILSVEPTFSIPLTDSINIVGKIDRIVCEKGTGLFHPVETKTVASWNPDVNRLMLDFQISLYSWAVSKMLHLSDVTFLYDVLRKPAQRLKKDETEADFISRIEKEVNECRGEYFFRDKVTRSRREIERTEKELLLRAQALIRARKSGEVYRTPGEHCFWMCSYMPPCLEDTPDMWDSLYYIEKTAHPELEDRPRD